MPNNRYEGRLNNRNDRRFDNRFDRRFDRGRQDRRREQLEPRLKDDHQRDPERHIVPMPTTYYYQLYQVQFRLVVILG